MSFAADIEELAHGEPIEAIVIGDMGWGDYNSDGKPSWPRGELLSWSDARPMLDYKYDRGFGAPDCQAVYAWTSTRVLFVSTYDGSTSVTSVPRNPIACMPDMPGGG